MQTEQDKIKEILNNLNNEEYNEINKQLDAIEPFLAHENKEISSQTRAVMTKEASEKFKEVFDILKLDYKTDPNLKDTPMRVASMWINELMVGRYQKKPRLESFPIPESWGDSKMMISKKVDIRSLCSHHLMPFFNVATDESSYGLIAYIPTDRLLGISKLQRLVHWYGGRPQLQENLSEQIHQDIHEVIKSKDVFVSLNNIEHTCESLRGVRSNGRTSSLFYSGVFNDPALRNEAIEQAK